MCAGVNENDLIKAVETGNIDEVRRLLEQGADVNATTKCGITALWLAIDGNHQEIIQLLKDAGATK